MDRRTLTWLAPLVDALVIAAALAPLVTALVLITGCGKREADAAAPSTRPVTPVEVQPVRVDAFRPRPIVPGIVEAESRLELGFRVGGLVARFHVEEGEHVEAGDVIAELDLADLERDVQTASAQLASASARVAEADLTLLVEPATHLALECRKRKRGERGAGRALLDPRAPALDAAG